MGLDETSGARSGRSYDVWTRIRSITLQGILSIAKLSIKELTSRIMSFMILAGGLDRLTTVLTTSYSDFTDGSRSKFQDLDPRIG